jgi:hypothetical protein
MKRNPEMRRKYIRNMLIEILIYGALLVVYFLLVLRFLGDWLFNLFNSNLVVYSIIGLGLLVVQAVVLEIITSFLMDFLRLEQ